MKKRVIAITMAVIVLPLLFLFRDRIVSLWAAPERLDTVEGAVIQQTQTQEQLKELYLEQKVANDRANDRQDVELDAQREITAAQLEAFKVIVENLKR